ncbi:MAG: hypothetical protein Q4G19_00960 [Clostridia bacterium]|nr:hypothetical protein [Clostridia bacterium]
MEPLLGFDTLPENVRSQLDRITRLWCDRLGADLLVFSIVRPFRPIQ